jgi:single-stranded DNA-binding protein
MNKVLLVGKVVSEPRKKNEKAPCEFRLETLEEWKGERPEDANTKEYHPLAVWGGKGEYCLKNVKKGDLVEIEGVLKHGSFSYDVKDEDGNVVMVKGAPLKVSRPTTEIKVVSLRIVRRATPREGVQSSQESE